MGKTQYFTATSIDGFIADQDNSLDWLFQADANGESAGGQQYRAFFEQVGAIAAGSTTYEWVLEHEQMLEKPEKWPYHGTPCWIFTHRQLPAVPGADITFVHGDVQAVHQQMAAAAGDRNIWLVGGGDLVGQFADHGLLDEIMLSVAPATLGGGAPLLPRTLLPGELALTGCRADGPFACLTYAVRVRRGDDPLCAS
jgi:dihydrofolate reductase